MTALRVLTTATVLATGVAVASCEVPTTCPAAIGVAFHDQPPTVVDRMRRIVWRESRNDPTARNGQHVGCFQIATSVHAALLARLKFTAADMARALPNALVARILYLEAGFAPWAATA